MVKKLNKTDKDFYRKIGKMGGDIRKAAGVDYSALAASSHACRTEYNGGRPKGSKNKKTLLKEKKEEKKLARIERNKEA